MPDLKPGDLIFVRGKDGLAHEIEFITHSPYSHVAGFVKPNELIEAQAFRKTGIQGLDYYKGCSDIFTCDPLTDAQRAQIVQFVMSKEGTNYNYWLIPWEAEHFIFHIDLPYQNKKGDEDCSQLWIDAYRSVGVDLCPGLRFGAPGDVANSKLLRRVGSF